MAADGACLPVFAPSLPLGKLGAGGRLNGDAQNKQLQVVVTQPLCAGFSGFEFKTPPPTGDYVGCWSQVDYGGSNNRFYWQREGEERLLALRICDAYFLHSGINCVNHY